MTAVKALAGELENLVLPSLNVRLNTHLRISWEKTQQLQRGLCHAVSVKILFQYLVFHAQVISSYLRLYEFFPKVFGGRLVLQATFLCGHLRSSGVSSVEYFRIKFIFRNRWGLIPKISRIFL